MNPKHLRRLLCYIELFHGKCIVSDSLDTTSIRNLNFYSITVQFYGIQWYGILFGVFHFREWKLEEFPPLEGSNFLNSYDCLSRWYSNSLDMAHHTFNRKANPSLSIEIQSFWTMSSVKHLKRWSYFIFFTTIWPPKWLNDICTNSRIQDYLKNLTALI